MIFDKLSLNIILRDFPTEVWNFENGNNRLIQPTFPQNNYAVGTGLYLVDSDYCKNKAICVQLLLGVFE